VVSFKYEMILARASCAPYASAGLLAVALLTAACNSPSRAIRPVIHARDEDKYQAMKSAPVILLAEIVNAKLISGARQVEKPKEVAGPMTPTIPLHLARVSARVLLTLRGTERQAVEFYSWVWASGSHGGPRLFHVWPGSKHILFLREEGGYLHTVGDYPAYDLEVSSDWLPEFESELKSTRESSFDLFERIATVRLRAELATPGDSRADFPFPLLDEVDLMGLTSPFFVASKLDSYCRSFPNRVGRLAACAVTANRFPGRCLAYRYAKEADFEGAQSRRLTQWFRSCEARTTAEIDYARQNNWRWPAFGDGWRQTPERRRLGMRLYASAMDPEFRRAACAAAASMPEARDIPECSTLKNNGYRNGERSEARASRASSRRAPGVHRSGP
jgi:hypothetical protein